MSDTLFDLDDVVEPNFECIGNQETTLKVQPSERADEVESKYTLKVPKSLKSEAIYHNEVYQQLFDLPSFSGPDLDKIFKCLDDVYPNNEVTDVVVSESKYLYIKKHKKIFPLFGRVLNTSEIEGFLTHMYGEDVIYGIQQTGDDLDESYTITHGSKLIRTRVNACFHSASTGKKGLAITFRRLPSKVPTFEALNVPQYIRDNCKPRDGLIIIAGETGSGKTTLAASIIHALNHDVDNPRFILTYEHPPEYLLEDLPGPNPVWQHAVGKYKPFSSFASGLRNALRRAPEVIYSGESRDAETFLILPRIAESGHLGLTTTHASNVAGVFTRIADEIGGNPETVIRKFVHFSHLIVVQWLAPAINGGVVPVQEWLLFTKEIKERILSKPGFEIVSEIRKVTAECGQTFEMCASKLLADGIISKATYHLATSTNSDSGN